jgi:hypothetical protein
MAHLLRPRGLDLLPGLAVEVATPRGSKGCLLISGGDLGPEARAAGAAGVSLIGQRWCAMRAEGEGLSLLSMPGRTERTSRPQLVGPIDLATSRWTDLGSGVRSTSLDLVLIADPQRRSRADAIRLSPGEAAPRLRDAWPLSVLTGTNLLASKLAKQADVHRVRLARDGAELYRLILGEPGRRAAA